MNFESIIFDIDGTLWNSLPLVAEAYNTQLRAEGLDSHCITAEDMAPHFGKVTEEFADGLFPRIPPEVRYPLMERCLAREVAYLRTQECRVGFPGVTETIAQLAKKHRLFIVSNCQLGYPDVCIEKLGLTPYIEGHLCFEETGTRKGLTLQTLIRKHNIGSCVYVGDTQGDCSAAAEAGMPFIFCPYGFGKAENYWAKIDRFADLLSL